MLLLMMLHLMLVLLGHAGQLTKDERRLHMDMFQLDSLASIPG
jgi:hypothetical protein